MTQDEVSLLSVVCKREADACISVDAESGQPGRLWTVAWRFDGQLLASAGSDKKIRLWRFSHGADVSAACNVDFDAEIGDSHTKTIRHVAFSHDGRRLTSASFDATIAIFQDLGGDWDELAKLEGHESEVKCAEFSPSDRFIASCARDKSVWFWEVDENEDDDVRVSSILQPHTQDVKAVAWHPADDILASCSYDGAVRLFTFDGEDWVTRQKIDDAHKDGTVWSVAFSKSGKFLFTTGSDSRLRVYSLTGEGIYAADCEIRADSSRWPIYAAAPHPVDERLIAIGGGDKTLWIYCIEENHETERRFLRKVASARLDADINCVRWHPTGIYLAVATDDALVILRFDGELRSEDDHEESR